MKYPDYIKSQLEHLPNIDMSNKCILQCVFCQRQTIRKGELVGKNKIKMSQDVPFEDWKKVLHTFQGVNLCGQLSDPIYHSNFIHYLRYAAERKKRIRIHTNGSGKKKSFWKEAFSIQHPIRWIFGIDGLDQKTCNLHRIGQNFHQSFKAMLLGSQSHHRIIWQFIPFQHNEHQIERAKDIAHKHNIDFMILKSNRWTTGNSIYVNNKPVVPDWIRPPEDTSLSNMGMHVKQEYYINGPFRKDV